MDWSQAPRLCLPCGVIDVGFKPFSCSDLVLTDFSGVTLLLALEESEKFTNVLGNSLSS